jgi:hypothetical protein
MRKAETGHVLSFMLMFLFIGYALLRSWFAAAAWLLTFNVMINGYPIVLQRYYRLHPTDGDHRVYFSNNIHLYPRGDIHGQSKRME